MPSMYRNVFEQIVSVTNDIVIVTEAGPLNVYGPRIIFVNNAFSDLTGYTTCEALGKTPRMLQGPKTDPATKSRIKEALRKQEPVRDIILNYAKSGEEYWLDINIIPLTDSNGVVTHFAAIERDVTEMKLREDDLKYVAMHDGLTGLLNRTAFMENANAEFARYRRHDRPLCLITLDIDHFKQINDTFGHAAGDEVLRRLGALLKKFGRTSDRPGRVGGEEMAILLPETELDDASELAESLRNDIQKMQFTFSGTELRITASLGLTCTVPTDKIFDTAMERCDQAMYRSKHDGRDRLTIAESEDIRTAA